MGTHGAKRKKIRKGIFDDEYNYACVFAAYTGEYLDDTKTILTIEDDVIGADKQAEKADLWENLSTEAKSVIDLVLNGPNEAMALLKSPKRGSIGKHSVIKFLRGQWLWPYRKIDSVMSELKTFVATF